MTTTITLRTHSEARVRFDFCSGFGIRPLSFALVSLAMSCAAISTSAQTVYRIVGPDGKVIFSDKPPTSADQGKLLGTGVGARGDAGGAGLPYELRQVVAKYPVTLYTAPNCSPCDTGRALLNTRGVPFTERTVTSNEDTDALKRLSGENSLPFLTIGGQKIKGMSDLEWTQYLDAAAYPKTSVLPANYKNAAPSPLVSIKKVEPASAAKAADKPPAQESPKPATPVVNPANPAGIQF
jgi:glutaredoxin